LDTPKFYFIYWCPIRKDWFLDPNVPENFIPGHTFREVCKAQGKAGGWRSWIRLEGGWSRAGGGWERLEGAWRRDGGGLAEAGRRLEAGG
jgi:hypothetical protein